MNSRQIDDHAIQTIFSHFIRRSIRIDCIGRRQNRIEGDKECAQNDGKDKNGNDNLYKGKTGREFRFSGFEFRVSSFKFRVSSFKFQVSSFKFQVSPRSVGPGCRFMEPIILLILLLILWSQKPVCSQAIDDSFKGYGKVDPLQILCRIFKNFRVHIRNTDLPAVTGKVLTEVSRVIRK